MNQLAKHLVSSRIGLTFGLVTIATTMWAGYLAARTGGVSGVCESSEGCDCHSASPNANGAATVTITGPQLVDAGTTHSYTITVTGGPSGTTGGFNLCATEGTLIAGTGSSLDNGELVHSNADNRSWTFEWTAQASGSALVDFFAVAQATDGSGRSGDSWNWYGGAQSTPFTIVVAGPLPVVPVTWGLLKATYR
jgi:hypothetical protein